MKKILLVVTLLALPVVVLAQGFVPLAPIPGLTDIPYEPNGLAAFFNNLYKFAIGIAAVLAIIEIIWGGLEISTQDSVSKNKDGKERIQNALFGLVLVLSPVLVFSLINPSILNLSLSLPPIDLSTAPVATSTPTTCPSGQIGTPPNCTLITGATSGTTITGTQPLCSQTVSGTCSPNPPACISGQWCYSTVKDSDQIPSTECFVTQIGCTTLYNAQIQGGYGITVISGSSCSLCP